MCVYGEAKLLSASARSVEIETDKDQQDSAG